MDTKQADCTAEAKKERYPGSPFDDDLESFARVAFQVVAQARRWDTIQAATDALYRARSECRSHVSEMHHLSSQGSGTTIPDAPIQPFTGGDWGLKPTAVRDGDAVTFGDDQQIYVLRDPRVKGEP